MTKLISKSLRVLKIKHGLFGHEILDKSLVELYCSNVILDDIKLIRWTVNCDACT